MDKFELANKIKNLEGLTDEEKSTLLGLLRKQKRYGLVWENKPEQVEEDLKTKVPVLKEVKERAIINDSDTEQYPNHVLIEGDNLHAEVVLDYVMPGSVDVIYIDPPYNTGNKDFVYNDSYVDSEDSYRHSKWLSFMSKRLKIAKKLLSDKGVIFISIDDHEQAQLKLLCDEIFNNANFEAQISYVRKTSGKQDSSNFVKSTEYILVYSKCKLWEAAELRAEEKVTNRYNKQDKDGKRYRETDLRKTGNADRRIDRPLMFYPFYFNPSSKELKVRKNSESSLLLKGFIEIWPIKTDGTEGRWRWAEETSLENLQFLEAKEMPKYKGKYTIYEKDYIDKKEDIRTIKEHTCWDRREFNSDNAMADFKALGFGNQDFPFPKSTALIKHIIYLSNGKRSTILDFFAGSGTTLQAVMQLNAEDGGHRQCILVTNNENGICENVTYERNKRVINGYTTPKGEHVEGLHGNNLRYYKTDFVEREHTMKNMRALVAAATDMLCIKEDMYQEMPEFGPWKKLPDFVARHFTDGKGGEMLIIYEEDHIEEIVDAIYNMEFAKKLKIYVFSPDRDPYSDEFEDVEEKVELCALPAAIYDAYREVTPRPDDKEIELAPVTEENEEEPWSINDEEDEQ